MIDYNVMVFVRYSFMQYTEIKGIDFYIVWQNGFSSIIIMPYSMYSQIRKFIILNEFNSFSEINIIKPKKAAHC